MIRHLLGGTLALLVAGCATRGSVRNVEREVQVLRATTARADSARAAELGRIIAMQQRIFDSLTVAHEGLLRFRGEVSRDLLDVQQQLVQIQELSGQSQRALQVLRRQLDDRSEQLAAGMMAADTGGAPAPGAPVEGPPVQPTPDQLYQASLRELTRGSLGTARAGFQEFLRTYPTHAQVPDALYFVGESFAVEDADSAASYYRQVVDRFSDSERAPTALYKTGLLAEQRRDAAAARAIFQRVIQQYPRSPEATLARDRLANLRP